jgi:hypothetical protein
MQVQASKAGENPEIRRRIQRVMQIGHSSDPPRAWNTWYDNLEFKIILDLCAEAK